MRHRHVSSASTPSSTKSDNAAPALTPTHPLSPPTPQPSSNPLLLLLALLAYLSLLTLLTLTINATLPGPYMDEPFHLSQTRHYCATHSLAYYDPKLTTPPGLYAAALALAGPLSATPWLGGAADWCGLAALRWYNVLWAAVGVVVYAAIVRHVYPFATDVQRLLAVAQFALLPLLFVYVPLYYTDTIATTAVLLVFYSAVSQPDLSINPSHNPLSTPLAQLVLSLLALAMRQTSVIWIAYTAGYVLVRRSQGAMYGPAGVRLRAGGVGGMGGLVDGVIGLWRACNVRLLWPYVGAGLAFGGFLVWNEGSVVLGDKSNHSFSLHLAQLLYLALTMAGLFIVRILTSTIPHTLLTTLRTATYHPARLLTLSTALAAGLAAIVLTVHTTTLIHPFLLSDNRHLTFYFARYVLRSHALVRYVLTPAYLAALLAVDGLMGGQPVLLRLGWWVCSALTVALTPLVELRYYVMPIVMWMVLVESGGGAAGQGGGVERVAAGVEGARTKWWLLSGLGQVVLFAVLDAALLYVFICRPFTWGDGSIARFML